ncbi:Tetratricopeptide TPR 2 repeat protein [Nitrosarchaeum koreense MY1]|uniref:Tetratricopeptide TPR 2 repeat protein n=2 Tax=Nitrosarchaeum TaxID=1007082 RepID=F9CVG7_9ARCH|nr:Tetratricopeptide TPR 2 repeat protein [Nitrosarchaeum koreense MY1]
MYRGVPLTYFMWAHQHSTRDSIQNYAEELFQEISPKLKPQVFLIGILREKKEGAEYVQFPICIQPEECGINLELFNDVDSVANSIWEKDGRRNMLYGMPYIHENHHAKVKRDSIRSAVQQLVDKNFEGKKVMSFVSQSVHLEGYEIFVVLQFDEDDYNSFYGLEGTSKFSRISLLDSLIWVFLGESLDTMYRPRAATAPQNILTDEKEVMRIAASDFVSSIIFTVCESRGSWNFLNTCNYVSSLKYEGDASNGKLIVCKEEEHPNLEVVLKLASPVQLTEYRKIRKLLEIASRDLSLYSDGLQILGLGKIKGKYDEKNKNLLTINFSGAQKWELIHGSHTMLSVENTNPKIPKLKINKDIFNDLLERTFQEISSEDIERLWSIVDIATTQKHGTLLIISSEAEKEAIRLKNQSTMVNPTLLNESLIRNVTSIDGATLLDSKGICHSIGAILDGMSTNKGTSERGARYNSAIRYVENNKKKCIAVIISEDGMVDLYPDLLSRIKKNDIEEYLNRLRIQFEKDVLDSEEYHDIMRWFDVHKFYLSQEQCDEINKIKAICNNKEKSDPYRIFIMWNDLKPNPDMDDSYFIDE